MVQKAVRISQILTRAAFENAVVVTGAIGGSTNASPPLLQHRGRAVVFSDAADFRARVVDPDLEVDVDSILSC